MYEDKDSLECLSKVSHLLLIFFTVRLVNGNSPNEGRVEVYHGDTWGTVCDHYWSITEANVICRSLGYSSAESFYNNAHFGQGRGDILLNHVSCTGDESSIFQCYHYGVGVNHCSHYDDVGVRCTNVGKVLT